MVTLSSDRPPAIVAEGLCKTYSNGRVQALRGIGMEVGEGEIYGIIGPDGAGKTTLFRVLTTLMKPDDGSATVCGLDIARNYKAIRRCIGYMPGRFSLYHDLTVEENLRFFATIFGTTLEHNYRLVAPIYSQIEKFKTRKAGKLSGGMKQKLALSCALIHAPKVLFLDEPTTGVDPVSRKEFWEMLRNLRQEHGLTIVASTPYMDEAMQCDRIALIQHGSFLQADTPQAIIGGYGKPLFAVKSSRMHSLLADLREWKGTATAFYFGEYLHLTVTDGSLADTLRPWLELRGHTRVEIKPISAGIEDCFMALQQPEMQESGAVGNNGLNGR